MPPHAPNDVGHRIVGIELPAGTPFADAVAGSERVLGLLRDRLGRWLGADACDVLIDRALVEARRKHPILVGVRWHEPRLVGLVATDSAGGGEALRLAVSALIDALTAQLGRLIGDDLAERLVLEGWDQPTPPGDRKEEP